MTPRETVEGAVDQDVEYAAVVGMAGQFPGAADINAFWHNLRDGVESVREFSPTELVDLGVDPAFAGSPDFVPYGATLDDIDAFDYGFWGYSPREAALIDPQQRLFLQVAWHALEHAGHDPLRYPGMIGVFAGMGLSTYLVFNLAGNAAVHDADTPLVMLGNDKDFLTTRTSYHLDLRGPSIAIQTGCSSSLVATHLACESLLSYQCDMAVVGGATVAVPQRTGYLHVPGGTASPDGHTRAFDAAAAGTVFGSGVGAVVLKRFSDALADRDTVYAVVRGSAVNNDGAKKIGFTAPRIDGQADVVLRAQQVADVNPRTVTYVETHGTATPMGDPMEIAALTKAFARGTSDRGFCAVGSVKTNVGHLDTAAGIAGLIKTCLALRHRRIPPSLNFTRPNPLIDFADTPFYVADTLAEWPAGPTPRRAGVSAFGFGGTNAHVVLEEAPEPESEPADDRPQILVLSARSPQALETITANLADTLGTAAQEISPTAPALEEVAYTLQRGRAVLPYRRALFVRNRADAVTALRTPNPRRYDGRQPEHDRPVAFLLPGLGDQYAGMGRDLYEYEPVFREALDRCADVLRRGLGLDLLAALYPAGAAEREGELDLRAMIGRVPQRVAIEPATLVHPAIFAVEWALAQQWLAWGVVPAALLGHSTGEWLAATLAGVFDVDDAITLIARRSRLIETLPVGAMLAVPLSADQTLAELDVDLSLALVNSTSLSVVSGTVEAVDALASRLKRRGLATRRIPSTHAYHSPAVRPILDRFVAEVAAVPRGIPRLPFVSNVTGTWITAAEATDPEYWGRHTESPVRFADGLSTLCHDRDHVLLEVGPGQSLSSLAATHLTAASRPADAVQAADAAERRVVTSMRASYDSRLTDREVMRDAVARLWGAGVEPDWDAVHAPRRPRRVAMPGYPFARDRAWISPVNPADADRLRKTATPTRPERGVDDAWLLTPGWRTLPAPPPRSSVDGTQWTVFCDGSPLSEGLRARLTADGAQVTVIEPDPAVRQLTAGNDRYRLDPGDPDQYAALVPRLRAANGALGPVVHLWSRLGSAPTPGGGDDVTTGLALDAGLQVGFYSLAYLGRALSGRPEHETIVCVLTDGIAALGPDDRLDATRATVLAPAKCIPQEYEAVTVHVLDVGIDLDAAARDASIATVLDTFAEQPVDRLIAVRGRRRWVRDHVPVPLERAVRPLPDGAVVVLLGGLGLIGLRLAEHLADTVRARLVLVGRTATPSTDEPAPSGMPASVGARVRRLRATGAEVIVERADASDPADLRRVLAAAADRFGGVDAIVHAAGIGGAAAFGLLDDIDPQLSERQFDAKIRSAVTLAAVHAAGPWKPRSIVLLSSNAALLGGLGSATYAAGNIYLDTLAEAVESDTHWVSVNLEEWLPDDGDTALGYETSFTQYAISATEGVQILQRALECACDRRVSIFTADLDQRVERWLEQPQAARQARPLVGRASRPSVTAEYAAPEGGVETAVAEVWSQVLGIAEIGRHDNFHELGGHSLLATQIVARLRVGTTLPVSLLSLFRSPTVARFAAELTIAGAGTESEVGADALAAVPVQHVSRDEALPASFAQRRFWFLDQYEAGVAYTILDVVRIDGPLLIENLRCALETVVKRHEALRTNLRAVDAEPMQMITAPDGVVVPFTVTDLVPRPQPDISLEHYPALIELTARQLEEPFDLAAGPLVRACLARFTPVEHVLLLSSHHSVSDAWSTGIILREFAEIYAATAAGRPPHLAPVSLHYADFAAWQHQRLAGSRRVELLEHWCAVMSGAPDLLALPTDRPRPASQSFRGAVYPVTLEPELVERLRTLAARHDATLFMALLAAFTAVLHLLSGQRDIVVGSPIASRLRPEFEQIVGAFVNMVALRTSVAPHQTFGELLDRVRDITLDAYDHQELPFELLVEALAPARDRSHNPVFQVALVMQNAPLPELRLGDLELTPLTMPTITARFDLMLMLREVAAGTVGTIEYSTDLFDEDTIARFEQALQTVLRQVVAAPDTPVDALELVAVAERERLLVDSPSPPGDGLGLLEAIDAVVRDRPDAPALYGTDGRVLSFRDLDERAGRVAARLSAAGVRPGGRVGLHLDRDVDAVAALIGVLRAGAAYVPLDPAYPRDRLAFMAADARLDVIVSLGAELPFPAAGQTVLCLEDALGFEPPRDGWSPAGSGSGNVVFVIYTSGSTGLPKGVLGTYGGMLNRLRWMWSAYPFGPDEVGVQKTSLNFLDSFWEIFGPLARGVPIVVVPYADLQDPARLIEILERFAVTRIVVVPSLLRALIDTVSDLERRLRRLRLWVTSGEALPPEMITRFHDTLPGRTLLNLYGTTEVSADVTAHEVTRADAARPSVPIGRPIPGVQVLLLDRRLRLVPDGNEGDVYVGGIALADGYIGRPALTSAAFVPHPFSATPGARLYRTGDRARRRLDGVLEYRGRLDDQVKIRGHRIELAEVERALRQLPGVAAAVTAVHGDTLVGYVVPSTAASAGRDALDPEELRVRLLSLLPGYAVPSAYVVMSLLPLTPSGKVDRRALPGLDAIASPAPVAITPRDDIEWVLVGLWHEVLGHSVQAAQTADVHANFFAVGGHSLLAMRLIARVNDSFGAALTVSVFFDTPTIIGIAAALRSGPIAAAEIERRAAMLLRISVLSDDEIAAMLAEAAPPREQQ